MSPQVQPQPFFPRAEWPLLQVQPTRQGEAGLQLLQLPTLWEPGSRHLLLPRSIHPAPAPPLCLVHQGCVQIWQPISKSEVDHLPGCLCHAPVFQNLVYSGQLHFPGVELKQCKQCQGEMNRRNVNCLKKTVLENNRRFQLRACMPWWTAGAAKKLGAQGSF